MRALELEEIRQTRAFVTSLEVYEKSATIPTSERVVTVWGS